MMLLVYPNEAVMCIQAISNSEEYNAKVKFWDDIAGEKMSGCLLFVVVVVVFVFPSMFYPCLLLICFCCLVIFLHSFRFQDAVYGTGSVD